MIEDFTAGLIVVGDEILRGQIVDMNTSYLAKKLKAAGITLRKVVGLPDVIDEIAEELIALSKRFSVVFTSGGVGPTHDDVTYEAVAKAFNLKLEENAMLAKNVKKQFPNEPAALRFATVPNPCELIYVGSEATSYAVIKVRNVYVLPGSPSYFQPAIDKIIPTLPGKAPVHCQSLDIDLDELKIVNILDNQAKKWAGKVCIGSYPQAGTKHFTRITLEGSEEDVLKAKKEIIFSLPSRNLILNDEFSQEDMKSVLNCDEAHVKNALKVLEECYTRYQPDTLFLSFNGGKDCTAVLHLVVTYCRSAKISPPCCLHVIGDSFPEVDEFVEKAAAFYGLELTEKEQPIIKAVSEFLEEKSHLKVGLMGVRRGDPGSSNLDYFTPTDPGWPQIIRVCPILDWSYEQVWQFLLKHRVPYCKLYDQGYTSLGGRNNTAPNPMLSDPNNPSSYLPAYTLSDNSKERHGRV